MTLKIKNLFLTFNLRYGFGLDIESCNSRPVYVYEKNELKPSVFDGLIFQIPFVTISLGSIFVIEVIKDEQ